MNGQSFDRYFDKVLPIIAIVAMMKTHLAEEAAKTAIIEIQKSSRKKLTTDEKKAVQSAADAVVARLNPDVFKLDSSWSPKSSEEVEKKLIELKFDAEFRERLTAEVIRTFREPQQRINGPV